MALSFLSQLGGAAGGNPTTGIYNPMAGSTATGAGPLGTPTPAGVSLGMSPAGGPSGSINRPAGPMGTTVGPDDGPLGGGLLAMGLGGGGARHHCEMSVRRRLRLVAPRSPRSGR